MNSNWIDKINDAFYATVAWLKLNGHLIPVVIFVRLPILMTLSGVELLGWGAHRLSEWLGQKLPGFK